ncbi:hypothetical protein O181_082163 [Austropuccinia psidii MF-1]|uniref:chitin deacetylase n=1 Tax=Austropuccinia psidii MF-1 TaxID=1389203 RepID=A0A9Q3FLY3_9BASI|nr:hypothetical protein [Austropuccinia psidii MF-1]
MRTRRYLRGKIYHHKFVYNDQIFKFKTSFLISIILILSSTSIFFFYSQTHSLSHLNQISKALSHRFPGTPINSNDAKIVWKSHSFLKHLSAFLIKSNHPPLGFSSSSYFSNLGFKSFHSTYPKPDQIGPRPKKQWIRRLNYLKKLAINSHNLDLINSFAIPIAKLEPDGLVTYPSNLELGPGLNGVCSWERTGCLRNSQNGYAQDLDIVDTDHQTWAVNFDDGPLPPSKSLYKLLDQFNTKATHFWIGGNVLIYWDLALTADKRGDHLAVHTWSHSHLTSLSDEQVLGELGWTIQIIFDLTGKIPKYFRPPYGNIDNRIRAIAKHVFGLETVIWNEDSIDWALNQTYSTGDQVDLPNPNDAPNLNQVIENIKQFSIDDKIKLNGLLLLEHELSQESVKAFEVSWKKVKDLGWKTGALPECIEDGKAKWYQN